MYYACVIWMSTQTHVLERTHTSRIVLQAPTLKTNHASIGQWIDNRELEALNSDQAAFMLGGFQQTTEFLCMVHFASGVCNACSAWVAFCWVWRQPHTVIRDRVTAISYSAKDLIITSCRPTTKMLAEHTHTLKNLVASCCAAYCESSYRMH